MKGIINAVLFFCFATVYGQTVADYQYVYVPKKFSDFYQNQYNLNKLLIKGLAAKNYIVIDEEAGNLQEVLQQNPCSVLTADFLKNSNMFRNKAILKLTDCKKNPVAELKATSMIKEFDLGFQEALKIALNQLPSSKQIPMKDTPDPDKTSVTVKYAEEEPTIKATLTEVPPKAQEKKTTAQAAVEKTNKNEGNKYSNGKVTLQKVDLGNQFILVSPDSSEPFATFNNSTRKDTYRVKLQNGTSTFGYYEEGNIVIEVTESDGSIRKEVFKKL